MAATGLVGRDAELAAVDGALEALDGGTGGFLLLSGDPGIGKSALLGAATDRARERGWNVLIGRAAEFERDLPFAVLSDALDARLAELDRPRLVRLGVERVDELAAMFPSLAHLAPEGPPLVADRHRAHRAVRELLDGLAATRPLVLVLDDLQWADPATVELLAALVRRPPSGRVLVLAAHRASPELAPLVTALGADGRAPLTLGPLGPDEAADLLGVRVDGPAREAVLRHAAGNPFFLEQLARAPQLAHAGGGAAFGIVPDGVRAAIRTELSTLDEATRTLLHGAAVAGQPFELRHAATAAGVDLATAAAGADAALAVGILHPTDSVGRFAFRHPLVRRAVYEDAGAGWRLAAHDRLRRELEAVGADVVLVAHHAEGAASVGDEPSIAALIAAADRVAARAPASAAHWYGAALRLLADPEGTRRAELQGRHGAALLAAGRLDEAREALLEADTQSVAAVMRLAQVETWLGLDEDARRRLERAMARLEPGDHADRAALALQLVVLHELNLRTQEAGVAASGALASAREARDPVVLGAVQAVLAGVLAHSDVAAANEVFDAAAAAFAACDDEELAPWLDSVYALGWAATHLERHEEGERVFTRGAQVARAAGATGMVAIMLANRALCALRDGRLREAWAVADEAVEVARTAPTRRFLWWTLFARSMTLGRAGDPDTARAALAECEAVAATLPPHAHVTLWTSFARAFSTAALGDPSGALADLERLAGGPDLPLVLNGDRHYARLIAISAAIGRGDLETAERWAAEGEDWAAESGLVGQLGWALRGRAMVTGARGDLVAAAEQSVASARAFERVGIAVEAERSRIAAAGCLVEAGERDRAVELLVAAESALHAVGAERDRQAAVRALRGLGRRVAPRAAEPSAAAATATAPGALPPASGALTALSDREREVAELVAQGRTNREVAEALFLSTKTVETHLRNIFAKLDVSSRAAVAAVVERERHASALAAS